MLLKRNKLYGEHSSRFRGHFRSNISSSYFPGFGTTERQSQYYLDEHKAIVRSLKVVRITDPKATVDELLLRRRGRRHLGRIRF